MSFVKIKRNIKNKKNGIYLKIVLKVQTTNLKSLCNQCGEICSRLKIYLEICGPAHKRTGYMINPDPSEIKMC